MSRPLRSSRASTPLMLAAFSLLSWLAIAGRGHAEPAEEMLARGNLALLSGNPAEASQLYGTLVDSGFEDVNLQYNWALAHAAEGRWGHAILDLERARKLDPGDDDVAALLSKVRSRLGEKLAQRRGEATVQTRPPLVEALTAPFSSNMFAVGLWLAVFGLSGSLGALMVLDRPGRRLSAGTAAALLAPVALVLAAGLTAKAGWAAEGPPAIVVSGDAIVRGTPGDVGPHLKTLVEGSRATLLEKRGSYSRLRAEGVQGWTGGSNLGTY
jgi:hypothetical protein